MSDLESKNENRQAVITIEDLEAVVTFPCDTGCYVEENRQKDAAQWAQNDDIDGEYEVYLKYDTAKDLERLLENSCFIHGMSLNLDLNSALAEKTSQLRASNGSYLNRGRIDTAEIRRSVMGRSQYEAYYP